MDICLIDKREISGVEVKDNEIFLAAKKGENLYGLFPVCCWMEEIVEGGGDSRTRFWISRLVLPFHLI